MITDKSTSVARNEYVRNECDSFFFARLSFRCIRLNPDAILIL